MAFRYSTVFVAIAEGQGHNLSAFYQALFNQRPAIDIPQVYTEFELLGARLGIFKPKATHLGEFAAPSSGGMSLCLEVENLEAAIAHLNELGYPPPGQIQQVSHGREIYAYDPCGNRLILHESKQ
ncbi:MAG: glyoxalase [Thermosynechococcaceae cyanobacterium MS004]|nr:glyoxalase [Thermosynechococcaceae cyanobacterium MS004]